MSATDWTTFNNKLSGSLTDGYVVRSTGASTTATGILMDNGLVAGINATSSSVNFNIQGTAGAFDPFSVASSSAATYLVVKQDGNIGIGTSTPTSKLDIYGTPGTADIFGVSSSSNARLFTITSAGNLITTGTITAGSGAITITDATGNIALTSGDGAGLTSSGSGMEAGTGGTGLIQGCANNEVLKWNEATSVWACGSSNYLKYITVTPVNVVNDTGNTADQAMTDVDVTAQTSATADAVALQVNMDYSNQTNTATWNAHVAPNGTAQSLDNVVCSIGDNDDTSGVLNCGATVIVDLDANQIFDYALDELLSAATVDFRINVIGYWDSVTTGADLAEYYYASDSSIRPGDVVSLDLDSPEGIRKSTGRYDETVLGVVSTEPGMILGTVPTSGVNGVQVLSESDAENITERIPLPIALAGRIPVNVSIENGIIKAGDLLTPSSIPGVAMKATKAGRVIGQALFGHDKEEIGAVMTFVNNTYYKGQSSESLLAGISYENTTQDLSRAILIKMISDKNSFVSENALDVSEIFADRIMAGSEVITPSVLTNILDTKNIIIGSDDGKLYFVNASSTQSTSSASIVFDNLGNASFAGEIKAGKINADSITGLEVITDKISSISTTIDGFTNTETWATKDSILSIKDIINILSASTTESYTKLGLLESQMVNFATVLGFDMSSSIDLSSKTSSVKSVLDTHNSSLEDINLRLTDLENNKDLNIDNLWSASGLSVNTIATFFDGLKVDTIDSIGGLLSVLSDVEFLGRPYFNTDTAGFALIKQGDKNVDVVFDREYVEQPIINVSMSSVDDETLSNDIFNNDIRFAITKKTQKGFTITLNKPAVSDINFDWTAFAVKNAKKSISVSDIVSSIITEDILFVPEIAPEIVASTTADISTTTEEIISGINDVASTTDAAVSDIDDTVLMISDTISPVITINGDSVISITVGDEYTDLGAIAIDDIDGEIEVSISGSVDSLATGTYMITYSATDISGNSSSIDRVINVNEAVSSEIQ